MHHPASEPSEQRSLLSEIVISSDVSLGSVKRLRGAGIFHQAMKPLDLEEVKLAVECA